MRRLATGILVIHRSGCGRQGSYTDRPQIVRCRSTGDSVGNGEEYEAPADLGHDWTANGPKLTGLEPHAKILRKLVRHQGRLAARSIVECDDCDKSTMQSRGLRPSSQCSTTIAPTRYPHARPPTTIAPRQHRWPTSSKQDR